MAAKRVTKQQVRQSAARQQEEKRRRRRERLNLILGVVVAVLAVVAIVYFVNQYFGSSDSSDGQLLAPNSEDRPLAAIEPAERDGYFDAYPEMVIDPAKDYEAVIRTDKGDIRLDLFSDVAPLTVNNFVFLANQGFYDGTIFHRVLEGFMAQGGDPTGSGRGGPGYEFEDEVDNDLVFDKLGILAMANRGPATNGSGFFITFVPTPHLNGAHTIFGELVEGEEVLNSLTFVEPGVPAPDGQQPDVITRIDIIER